MIKVALNGGLGNQLFQYAAGKALAVKHNTSLSFDVIPLYSKLQFKNMATYRKFELDIFSINAVSNQPLFTNKYLYPFAKTGYLMNIVWNKIRYHYFSEKSFEFDLSFINQPDNSYLDGHFQSEKYFKEIDSVIRKELTFNKPLSHKNLIWQQKMQQGNTVSIHIRRGDYASLQKNLNKHGVIPLEYYQKAVKLMDSKIQQPSFFIFTDDVRWVEQNFRIDYPYEIIDNNNSTETSYIDMQLMSLCSHNIICNSTFSWWAAWLNNHPEKIVIAPENWFTDKSINASDLLPNEWIKL